MKTSESLKKLISRRSADKKTFIRKIKDTHGELAVNKIVRCGLDEALKGMKADLKKADRDGDYALASSIRCMINATRTKLPRLLRYQKLMKELLTFFHNQVDELSVEIKSLDVAWEQAKADEAAAQV